MDKPITEYVFRKLKIQEIQAVDRVPKPRAGHIIVAHNGRVYSWGGLNQDIDENDPELSNDPAWQVSKPLFRELWELNLSTRTWTKCNTSGEVPDHHASIGVWRLADIWWPGSSVDLEQHRHKLPSWD